MIDATVSLEGTDYSAISDSYGSFTFKGIPEGSYTMVINAPNFKSLRQQVSVTSGQSETLNISPLQLSTIYTQDQLDQTVADASSNFDVNGDGNVGLAEASYALQVVSGIRNKATPVFSGPPAPVAKTSQTISFTNGDDGELKKGVVWPDPRFTDNQDGTVTDNLTGLIWLKDANPVGAKTWADAVAYCNQVATGQAGLTDGSVASDWRLPNRFELESLLDLGRYDPAISAEHPFVNVRSDDYYWLSTTKADYANPPWYVDLDYGIVEVGDPSHPKFVWPVRGGNW